MKTTNKLYEIAIHNIVNRVLSKLLEEAVAQESSFDLDEIKRVLIGKKLLINIMELDNDRKWKPFSDKVIDYIQKYEPHFSEKVDDCYQVFFNGGGWEFSGQQLKTLATRGRLYEYYPGEYYADESGNELFLYEIH